MIRYGKPNCPHTWRYRFNSLENEFEDECIPIICVECGAFGCGCDMTEDIPKDIFFSKGQRYDANINGKWINPYIKKENNNENISNK